MNGDMGYWSEDELDILRTNMADHPLHWEGWAELLPGRTYDAIRRRANLLRDAGDVGTMDPRRMGLPERTCSIFEAFAEGATCREVDRMRGLPEGTTRRTVMEVWQTDQRMMLDAKRARARAEVDE